MFIKVKELTRLKSLISDRPGNGENFFCKNSGKYNSYLCAKSVVCERAKHGENTFPKRLIQGFMYDTFV